MEEHKEDNEQKEKRNLGDDFFEEARHKHHKSSEPDKESHKLSENHEKPKFHEPIKQHEPVKEQEPVKIVKNKRNSWKFFSLILLILLIVSVFVDYSPYTAKEEGLSADEAATKALDLINTNFLQGQAVAELTNVEESGNVYKMSLSVSGQEMEGYITKDGKLFFPQVVELDELQPPVQQQQQQPAEVVKSEKPTVEVFVMSHCPYGTQIEKGVLPVAYLLGDKIDFDVKFVSYAMHGEKEVTEQLMQYCIQESQNDKFLDYLQCFLEDSDGERCLAETEIDLELLATCLSATDQEFEVTTNLEDEALWLNGQFPQFNVHKAENDLYGVRGSPALVINGQTVSAGRDSVSLLNAVCDAFDVAPEECSTELEAATPSPGFGWSGTGSNNVASCGG